MFRQRVCAHLPKTSPLLIHSCHQWPSRTLTSIRAKLAPNTSQSSWPYQQCLLWESTRLSMEKIRHSRSTTKRSKPIFTLTTRIQPAQHTMTLPRHRAPSLTSPTTNGSMAPSFPILSLIRRSRASVMWWITVIIRRAGSHQSMVSGGLSMISLP